VYNALEKCVSIREANYVPAHKAVLFNGKVTFVLNEFIRNINDAELVPGLKIHVFWHVTPCRLVHS
jgi:hypothetical protein